jgi:hypothetical protein
VFESLLFSTWLAVCLLWSLNLWGCFLFLIIILFWAPRGGCAWCSWFVSWLKVEILYLSTSENTSISDYAVNSLLLYLLIETTEKTAIGLNQHQHHKLNIYMYMDKLYCIVLYCTLLLFVYSFVIYILD